MAGGSTEGRNKENMKLTEGSYTHKLLTENSRERDAVVWVREELLRGGSQWTADSAEPVIPPPWLDEEKLRRGQNFFHNNFLSIFVSNLVGLLCLLSVPSILHVLSASQRSATPATAYKRYLSTLTHVMRWYGGEIFNTESSAFKSIQAVRKMHASAFACTPASQADLALTQWAFFGLVVTRGNHLGLTLTRNEEEGLVHFWRAVGYLMGIDDRYNLCTGDLSDVRKKCDAITTHVMLKGLQDPPPDFPLMADALLKGVHRITPVLDPNTLRAFAFHLLGHKYTDDLSWYSAFMFAVMKCNFGIVLDIPVLSSCLRLVENNLLRLNIYICNSFPVLVRACTSFEIYVIAVMNLLLELYQKASYILRSLISGNRKEATS